MDHLDFSSPVCRWDWKFQGDLELELGSRAQLKATCHGLSASALQTIHTKSVCLNPPKEVEGIYKSKHCQYHNGLQRSALLYEQLRRAIDNSNLLPKCRFQAVAKLLAVTKGLVNRNRQPKYHRFYALVVSQLEFLGQSCFCSKVLPTCVSSRAMGADLARICWLNIFPDDKYSVLCEKIFLMCSNVCNKLDAVSPSALTNSDWLSHEKEAFQ